MKNEQLKKDLSKIIANRSNIKEVNKGSIGGESIEVIYSNPLSYDTYLYYNKVEDRDADLIELEKQLAEA